MKPGLEAALRPARARQLGARAGRRIGGGLAYAGSALVLTWPLAPRIASHVPLGSETSPTPPLFGLWTLEWSTAWWWGEAGSYWDAPIFHPFSGTFALADPQVLTGAAAAALAPLGSGAAYNGILLLFLLLDALAVRRLLMHRGMGPGAAWLGGLLAQALPFLTHERGVLQLQPFFGAVFAIDELWLLAERGRARHGALFGLGAAATFLTSEYYAVFLVLVVAPALAFLAPALVRVRPLAGLALGIGIAAALVAPVGLSQLSALEALQAAHTAELPPAHAASPGDYLRASPVVRGAVLPLSGGSARALSPGVALLALAAAGGIVGLLRRSTRRWSAYALVAGGVAFAASLGSELEGAGLAPYEALRAGVPGWAAVRSPFRLAVFVQLFVVLLAAIPLSRLFERRAGWAALALAALALLESVPAPARLAPVPDTFERDALSGPVAFLPYVEGRGSADYAKTVMVMRAVLPTGASLVNGYSGRFPEAHRTLKRLLKGFPTPEGLRALRALGVRTLLVEADLLPPTQQRRLARALRSGELAYEGALRGLRVLRLPEARLRPVSEYEGAWELRLQAREEGEEVLEVTAVPAQPGVGMYVLGPGVVRPRWRAELLSSDAELRTWEGRLSGAFLLHRGAEEGPRLTLPLPRDGAPHRFELRHATTGRLLGTAILRRPAAPPSGAEGSE